MVHTLLSHHWMGLSSYQYVNPVPLTTKIPFYPITLFQGRSGCSIVYCFFVCLLLLLSSANINPFPSWLAIVDFICTKNQTRNQQRLKKKTNTYTHAQKRIGRRVGPRENEKTSFAKAIPELFITKEAATTICVSFRVDVAPKTAIGEESNHFFLSEQKINKFILAFGLKNNMADWATYTCTIYNTNISI